ncbi:MAG: GntR family transcriptional regulator [Bacteriovoracaceae bacterium]|jgi:DNA-binding transcriptional MocR family regulator|nr:GntR family transcriptional regulator [Bacteriovoracaceae bacterium]
MEQCIKISFSGGPYSGVGIAADIETEVEKGRLPEDSKLPPVRVLGHQLGVSKSTVTKAYDELVSRGLVRNIDRKGYYIESSFTAKTKQFGEVCLPKLIASNFATRPSVPVNLINISGIFIDPDLLPKKKLTQCLKSVLNSPGLPAFYDH